MDKIYYVMYWRNEAMLPADIMVKDVCVTRISTGLGDAEEYAADCVKAGHIVHITEHIKSYV